MSNTTPRPSLFVLLDNLDRRIIYLFVVLSLAVPIFLQTTLPPAEMKTATAFHQVLENLKPEQGIVLISMDWGPGTQAENKQQTVVAIEQLMRRRIPFAVISLYQLAVPFLRDVPREVAARLEQEHPGSKWVYGVDWINLGFQPGGFTAIESLAKAKDFRSQLRTDFSGTPIADLPLMNNVKNIHDISLLIQITGLVGVFNSWIQFFQSDGFRPPMLHGCTSITIPEAHIYYASKQIIGLHEGIAGAAWHDALLAKQYPNRIPGTTQRINTSLAFANLLILAFIFLGNLGLFLQSMKKRSGTGASHGS